MKIKILFLTVFLFGFCFYMKYAAPSVTPGDSGEFIAAAVTLSLPHAPSFPFYVVAAHVFRDMIPWGSDPLKINYFSAFISGGSLIIFLLILKIRAIPLGPGLCLTIMAGLSSSFWHNSLVTEVFSLNTFLVLVLLAVYGVILSNQDGKYRKWVLFSFIFGLGLGNHHILVFLGLLPIIEFLKKRISTKLLGFMIFFGLLGFSVNLFLPIRSQTEPPLNWGRPTTLHRFYRTLARKDYGSLKLTLDDSPSRSFKNTLNQLIRFSNHLDKEIFVVGALLGLVGLVWGSFKGDLFLKGGFIMFVLFGPFFYLLGNLPFNGQSTGIMGRFFIVPALLLLLGISQWIRIYPRTLCGLLAGMALLLFLRENTQASGIRSYMMTHDYGQGMLRTLPRNSSLFMVGGDDAFYSLATLHFVLNQRKDTHLYDRGGLIFPNPYGSDFRKLPPEKKEIRRILIEKSHLEKGPLFYSTMDEKILPHIPLVQIGYLMEAGKASKPRIDWEIIILRNLYPHLRGEYRSRALAAFFPFMRGRELLEKDKLDLGLKYLRKAISIGKDVNWLESNLTYVYSQQAYRHLNKGNLSSAESIYQDWIRWDGGNLQNLGNLGVVYERKGEIQKAKEIYQFASQKFPSHPQPVYNLAVQYWKEQNWPVVIELLKETIRRDPGHSEAKLFLEKAMSRNINP